MAWCYEEYHHWANLPKIEEYFLELSAKNLHNSVSGLLLHQQKTILHLIHWCCVQKSFLRPLRPVHLEVYCNTKLCLEASCHTSIPSGHTSQYHCLSGRTSQYYHSSEFSPDLSEGQNASPLQSESE